MKKTVKTLYSGAPKSMQRLLLETLRRSNGIIAYQELLCALELAWPVENIPRGLDGEFCAEEYIQALCKRGLLHHDRERERIISTEKVSFNWLRERLQEASTRLINILPKGEEPVLPVRKFVKRLPLLLYDRDGLDILADFATAYSLFHTSPNSYWIPGAHAFFKDNKALATIMLGEQSWKAKARARAGKEYRRWKREAEKQQSKRS